MDFYDLAYSKALESRISKELGFKKIYSIGDHIKLSDPKSTQNNIADSLCIGFSGEELCAAAKMSPKAILVRDSRIDRKLIEILKSKNVILCVAFDDVIANKGLTRASKLYMISKLFRYAQKKNIKVAFVTLARDELMLCSYIQLIELAKLIGADEQYTRNAIHKTNYELISE